MTTSNERLGISDERADVLGKIGATVSEKMLTEKDFGKAKFIKEILNRKDLTDVEKGFTLFISGGTLVKMGVM